MKILFTPVGGSDPIKRMLDGPMLHCCRIYKPDVVYIYFTNKMIEYERKDQRYTWAVGKLGEHLGHDFDIKMIEREELTDPHIFDSFYDDFANIISDIEEEYPDAQIYLNASSGTPAMKSAFVTIAAMSERKLNVIQVSSGEKKPLHDRDKDDTYDKYEQWECDMDNSEPVDRTSLVESVNLAAKIKKQNIRRLVLAYDYSAALDVANDVSEHLDKNVIKLISAAEARLRLDYNGVVKALADTEYDIIPVKDDKKRKITEYLFWLDIILKRGDYLGFIRGITPAAMQLMEAAVEKCTPIGDIKNYCLTQKKVHFILSTDIMKQSDMGLKMLAVLDENFSGFQSREYTTAQLAPLIVEFCEDKKVCGYVQTIRKAEKELRNAAAHTIIAINDDVIKRRINMTSSELYDVIKKLAIRAGIVRKDIWNSYDEMNKLILDTLAEV